MTGQEVVAEFHRKDLLKEFWPPLAAEIEYRERYLRFSHQIEARLTHQINEMSLDAEIDFKTLQLSRSCYAACDASNAPIGCMNTITKDIKENGKSNGKYAEGFSMEQIDKLNVIKSSPEVDFLIPVGADNHLEQHIATQGLLATCAILFR